MLSKAIPTWFVLRISIVHLPCLVRSRIVSKCTIIHVSRTSDHFFELHLLFIGRVYPKLSNKKSRGIRSTNRRLSDSENVADFSRTHEYLMILLLLCCMDYTAKSLFRQSFSRKVTLFVVHYRVKTRGFSILYSG